MVVRDITLHSRFYHLPLQLLCTQVREHMAASKTVWRRTEPDIKEVGQHADRHCRWNVDIHNDLPLWDSLGLRAFHGVCFLGPVTPPGLCLHRNVLLYARDN